MHNRRRILPGVLRSIALPVILFASVASAQTKPAAPARAATPLSAASAPLPTEKDLAATRQELIKLLRMSPTLTTVVAHDPSLLANQDYVAHNPEFYLFTHMSPSDSGPDEALERAVWPEFGNRRRDTNMSNIVDPIAGAVAFACFLAALIWMIRVFLENRRWGRIFKLQSEVHGRLIDKFSSNQELALYMETEAGKRFLEAAPIPVGFEPDQRVPNAVARVLTPLQIGIVLSLLGAGFYLLRNAGPDMATPMLVLGTVALMPGLGFIVSAGVTWVLAGRLGLIPENPASSGKFDPPSSFTGQQ